MAQRKQLTPWQVLVVEQLVSRAIEFEAHKYDVASLKSLLEAWTKAKKVTITFE